MDIKQHRERYMKSLYDHLSKVYLYDLDAIIALLMDTKRRVFIAGNGGSAATASHFEEDLSYGAGRSNVINLVSNIPYITAIANDEQYDKVFVRQLEKSFKSGDILIVFSCSGNSANLLEVADYVNAHGGLTIGFLGFDGGLLKNKCCYCVHVETDKIGHWSYGPIEDVHLILCHIITTGMEEMNGN